MFLRIKEGDIYWFESSFDKAKIYFPHFGSDTQIIEPKILREWFKEKFLAASK